MTEAQIQRQVLDYLAAKRIFAFRLNTAAIKTEKRFFRSHGLGIGAADILALYTRDVWYAGQTFRGTMPIWIECKSPSGRQSAEQKTFADHVRAQGHFYVLARSVDDVMQLFERCGAERGAEAGQ